MKRPDQSDRPDEFAIESFGNGIAYQVVRKDNGDTVFLQGDDALQLNQNLERTNGHVSDEDVVSQYFA